jgi:hypothetical protein
MDKHEQSQRARPQRRVPRAASVEPLSEPRASRRKAAAARQIESRARAPRAAENAIREAKPRVRAPKKKARATNEIDLRRDEQTGEDQRASGAPLAAAQQPGAASTWVPSDIAQRFVRVGREYFFADGARAFTDQGRRLSTPSENTEVIRSLVSIAQYRGWQSVTLSGTERFRKEAWMAARVAGLAVRGYKPTAFEQERLVRTLARGSASPSTQEPASAAGEEAVRSGDSQLRRGPRASAKPADDLITGRLIDHGRATYRHDPKGTMSYFVKVETKRGDRTIWGVDLERALKQSLSDPKIGDEIGLRTVRRDPVTVKAFERDERGAVLSNREVARLRNRWVVEQRSFFDARATAASAFSDPQTSVIDGARRHPELLGSYLQLRSAQELAAQRLQDPQDQQAFVARVRRVLAESIAQGEPLPTVRLKQRAEAKPPTGERRAVRESAAVR